MAVAQAHSPSTLTAGGDYISHMVTDFVDGSVFDQRVLRLPLFEAIADFKRFDLSKKLGHELAGGRIKNVKMAETLIHWPLISASVLSRVGAFSGERGMFSRP